MTIFSDPQVKTLSEDALRAQIQSMADFNAAFASGGGDKQVMADANAKSQDLWMVNPNLLYVQPGYNPRVQNRVYFEGVRLLAEEMKVKGFRKDKPIAAYIAKIDGVDRLVVQDGHRRTASVQLAISEGADIQAVPVVLIERNQDMKALTLGLLHANDGAPFSTYEKAILVKRLKALDMADKDIAVEMRITAAAVGQLYTLATAPDTIQKLVETGQVSAYAAIDAIKEHGDEAQGVLEGRVSTANSKGQKRATAKHDPKAARERRAKSLGYEFYKALDKFFKNEPEAVKKMSTPLYTELDALMTKVDDAGKPKPEKVVKPKDKPLKAPGCEEGRTGEEGSCSQEDADCEEDRQGRQEVNRRGAAAPRFIKESA